ncbi:MAG: GYF domain-containing protein [Bryobacteraceae bacterium]
MQYFISRGGQTYGPYPEEEIRRMLSEGRILASDLCWTQGMPQWQPVSQVFGAPAVPAPPPPAAVHAPGTARPAAAAWPAPPGMHWLAVLLLGWITCGIFGLVWVFVQANFVKKIDPASPARGFFIGSLAVSLLTNPAMFLASLVDRPGLAVMALAALLIPVSVALFLLGVFSMRRSLLHHYNTVESIGLRLNAVLTFFFNILYFQYHFTRIARWKRTGILH